MATKIVMPKVMMTVTEGTITKWIKGAGEKVEKGEPLMAIMTEKIEYEVPAPDSGIVHPILPEGQTVPYGITVGWILAPGEAVPTVVEEEAVVRLSAVADDAVAASTRPKGAPAPAKEAPVEVAPSGPVKASPAAKRLATELGVALAKVKGTGPDGRVVEEDIRKAAEEMKKAPPVAAPSPAAPTPPPAPPRPAVPGRVVKFSGMRKTVAERMMSSLHNSAQLTNIAEVDVSELVRLRNQLVEDWKDKGVRVTYTDIIVKAAAKALTEFPRVNANVIGDEIHYLEQVNVGLATALEEGLIVPVIRNADKTSLFNVAKISRELVQKARSGKLTYEEITGGTFTVSTLGMYATDIFTPIINAPEVAILGVGRIVEKPVVYKGEITKRSMMFLSLTYDHRVVDGAVAAEFLRRVMELLEKPHLIFI